MNSVLKKELKKPLFLSAFFELAEAGEDMSHCSSVYALYSAIVAHDVDFLGNRDGKRWNAEYALTKLLPALASKLDCTYFDYDTLKKAFLQAFLDTSYAHRGLDNISSDLLARFRTALSENESQIFSDLTIIDRLAHYKDIFLEQHYLVQVDENHFRFSHVSWLQYLQIQHIVNEVYKTDAKAIPATVPPQQIRRYFEPSELGKQAEHEDPVTIAAAAFEKTALRNRKRIIPYWLKIALTIGTAGVLACLILLVIHFWPKTTMYDFSLTPGTSDMTLIEFDEAVATIKDRVELMAGGKKHRFSVNHNTITFSLPQTAIGSMKPVSAAQAYICWEQNFCLIDTASMDAWRNNYDYVTIKQQDIEYVSENYGFIPGFDISNHEKLNAEGYNYLEICMSESWSKENRDNIIKWVNPWLAENINYNSFYYNDSVLVYEEGGNVIICVAFDDEVTENQIDTLVYNLTHPPLAHGFNVDVPQKVTWEEPKEVTKPGILQCKESSFKKKNTITIYYDTNITDRDTGAWIDLLIALRSRMDSLGEPYAIGYRIKDTTDAYQLLIKTLPNHVNTPIFHMLTTSYSSDFSAVIDAHRYSSIYSAYDDNVARKIETGSGHIVFGVKTEENIDGKTLADFASEYAETGAQELRFQINNIPIFTTSIDNISDNGEVLFDTIFWNGEQITKKTEWLVDYALELFNASRLPSNITYYGVTTDAPEGVTIEDYFEVNNQNRMDHYSDVVKCAVNRDVRQGVAQRDETLYLVFLDLPVNEDLPATALEEIEAIYKGFDFGRSEFRNLRIYLGDEDSLQNEKARIAFYKDFTDDSIDLLVVMSGGRYEKYADRLYELINNSDFFKEFDID